MSELDIATEQEVSNDPPQTVSTELKPDVESNENTKTSDEKVDDEEEEEEEKDSDKPLTDDGVDVTVENPPPQSSATDSLDETKPEQTPTLEVDNSVATSTTTTTSASALASASTPIKKKLAPVNSVNESATISFIKTSFDRIVTIKEIVKKHPDIIAATTKAITILKSGELPSQDIIFEPLKLSCEKGNVEAKIVALDCLSKIFTFNVFNSPKLIFFKKSKPDLKTDADMDSSIEGNGSSNIDGGQMPLIEAAVQVISACFDGEGTDEKIELQVIRVLTAAILNESMPVHGKILLQAVRQIYNIFLLSLSPVNQGIAQATLTQVVNIVFDKVKSARKKLSKRSSFVSINNNTDNNGSITPTTTAPVHSAEKMTLKQMEDSLQQNDNIQLSSTSDDMFTDENELIVKDAFLIFRSMSNLSVKVVENGSIDMRSHSIRSKLLSLHIVHWVLKNHIEVFLDKDCIIINKATNERTVLIDAVRKYICLILSRNAASQLAPVYEISLEIYWIMIDKLRNEFKSEIPVFLDEIYFPISDMKSSSSHQKRYLLNVVQRICNDPKALIELYLNYDCDPSMPNLCESIMDYLAKFALSRVDATMAQKVSYKESLTRKMATYDLNDVPQLNVSKLGGHPPNPDANLNFPIEYALKMTSIDCIVGFLRSLNRWSGKPLNPINGAGIESINGNGESLTGSLASLGYFNRERAFTNGSSYSQAEGNDSANISIGGGETVIHTPTEETSVTGSTSQFETIKQRKTAFLDSVKLFNFSPKKGMKALLENKFIPSDSPSDIAQFLLETETLDKAVIGEFLGEGDEKHISIMHSFVDLMDFKNKNMLEALRFFLQHFRLPGESQKIDRFMLKFADKYVNDNPNVFANADTVYILSYSVILLNTDQHSIQVKNRMTLEDFLNNNRGIDDGKDLDPKFLEEIYLDIQNDEILLKSEQHAALISNDVQNVQNSNTLFGGRDLAKEAYLKASKEMANKTEQAVKSLRDLNKKHSKVIFYSAENSNNNAEHVRSIFENLWMSILAGLTPPFKDYDDDDTTKALLEGIKLSIDISCMFDLDYARTSFIRALVQFCNLNNPEELKDKNIAAIYTLLEIAVEENNSLKDSWKNILSSISQIERLKLLAQGINSDVVPDLLNARLANRNSLESNRSSNNNTGFFASFGKKQSISEQTFQHHYNQKLPIELIHKINSTDLDVAMDKVFSKSSTIEGNGIFDFISSLSEVAHEEIESSGSSESPRMFSLQKMVDVCYYNMGRIRVQWSALWSVMNEKFNEFGCHKNNTIAFFALDSLRQLSERFFEIEELSHFKFQKEFLKPFNYIMLNNNDLQVREMVLDCVNYMICKKSDSIRSGWVTLLEILTNAAKDSNENFVAKGFKYVNMTLKEHFEEVFKSDAYESLVICLTEYAKNEKFQKTSLQSLQAMKNIVKVISKKSGISENENTSKMDELTVNQLWFPLLFGFHDVIMTGDDLEVRSEALNFMFDALVKNGGHFEGEFWDRICNELLFPIFGGLSKHWEIESNQDDIISVWMSTTLIQALRNMIALFGFYFETLSRMMDGYLKLLVSCICQDNETISKIGIQCLKELIIQNMDGFTQDHWNKINSSFANLFELTTAKELFQADPLKSVENNGNGNGNGHHHSYGQEEDEEEEGDDVSVAVGQSIDEIDASKSPLSRDRSKDKSAIVIKCVLQLHMIDILAELFDVNEFCNTIPVSNLLQLAGLLESSYKFAREFNEDYNLRVRLWNAGVINKLPNLLKQETSSVAVYISILFRIYTDVEKSNEETRSSIAGILIPMGVSILDRYVKLDELEQSRNIQTWRPVVVEILQAYTELEQKDFVDCCPMVYDLVIQLFDKSLMSDLRLTVQTFLRRVGDVYVVEK
ncbi:hypothetical protein CANARDRAFT_30309 [[Candida] arabinofermentans NRRL YB-2248]|uniref:SEC7 domain-containing protein n=1 Tax=[Candida] arabinofermentans NRRL YB-2248 TaxID=983967 RepID=A0A1E4SUC3_9ASCO|nr:hypothetical protein CANARDRAFT_30309 [[Candida] arabinofermentans NRRL YB-2248]